VTPGKSDEMSRPDRTQLLGVLVLGVLVRLAFLVWAEPLELWADEGQYAYQAIAWNRFGFYLGSPGWVWPPGYAAYLAPFFRVFGEGGVFAAKLGQVLLSSVVGASVFLLARRLFDLRAARLAGLLWAVYLPLIGFTHYLWPETLFLALLAPAVLLFLHVVDGEDRTRDALRMAAVGVLLGLACLVKEAALPLLLLLPLVRIAARGETALAGRAGEAGVLLLAATAVLAPWTLRNLEVYGRLVPSGSTLGENLYQGVNADYVNFDYAGGHALKAVGTSGPVYRWLVRWPADAEKWERSTAPNTIDRTRENLASARAFAAEHPGFVLRSRLKKLADWVTPLNFFQRHLRLEVYRGSLASPWARTPLVLLSLALTALVLAGGIGGIGLAVDGGPRRWTLLAIVATFLAGTLVVSMSRYRVPVEPFLLVAAAGFLTRAGRSAPARPATIATRALWIGIGLAWLLNAREILFVLRETL
jgi:4-amino-4-deoxy-L-arabinose transferase-like glycosyltransferase